MAAKLRGCAKREHNSVLTLGAFSAAVYYSTIMVSSGLSTVQQPTSVSHWPRLVVTENGLQVTFGLDTDQR